VSYQRIPYLIIFEELAAYKDTYAGPMDQVVLKAHLLKPEGQPADTVVILMHPIGGGEYLPMTVALAKAGCHVIYCQSRYPNNDSALIMEKVALDMAACVRDAKERLGYANVVLAGWSGGAALSLFYQSQAESPSVVATPAGEPPDLTVTDLIPADGIMLLAAHIGRSHTLTQWLDPSIVDETDPDCRDAALNLYDPKNPCQPPYDAAFIDQYRSAQRARNQRISAWALDRLAAFKAAGEPFREQGFVVHGTMADPKWLDPSIDPNGRRPRWCFLGDPEVVNMSPVGLARFCTLRSWLSQWSDEHSNADGVRCAPKVSVPALVIGNGADDACTPSDTEALFNALGSRDKIRTTIEGANHYYFGQPGLLAISVEHCVTWLSERFPSVNAEK
jgi:dienelactone hydrolase